MATSQDRQRPRRPEGRPLTCQKEVRFRRLLEREPESPMDEVIPRSGLRPTAAHAILRAWDAAGVIRRRAMFDRKSGRWRVYVSWIQPTEKAA